MIMAMVPHKTTSAGVPIIPRQHLSTETRFNARERGGAVLITGEKISYKKGVGYLYTHSYSLRAKLDTFLHWWDGKVL